MRKCELLRLPSFAAHSCLVTHDKGQKNPEEQWRERTIRAVERELPRVPSLILCNLLIIWYDGWHRSDWACGFSCSITHSSSWWGSGLFTCLRSLWATTTKATSATNIHRMDVFCPRSATKASPIVLGRYRPVNNPVWSSTNAGFTGGKVRFKSMIPRRRITAARVATPGYHRWSAQT